MPADAVPVYPSSVAPALLPSALGRSFRFLAASSWTTYFGDVLALVAAPLLVASFTHEPLIVMLAPLLKYLPWPLFGLVAGGLADRWDRRRLLLVTNVARAVVVVLLVATIATRTVTLPIALVAIFALGVCEAFAETTSQAVLPDLVSADHLDLANSRLNAGFTLSMLVGPAAAAALFEADKAWPFAAQLVCLVAAIAFLAGLRLPPRHRGESHPSILSQIRTGMQWLWSDRAVRGLAIVWTIASINFGAAMAVLVLYVEDHLGLGDLGYGVLLSISALGGLVGTVGYPWLAQYVSAGVVFRTCVIVEVLLYLWFALISNPVVAGIAMFLQGTYGWVWETVANSLRQRAVPLEFQGRVGSVVLVGGYAGVAVGNLIGGVAAHLAGPTAPFWFAFVAGTLVTVLLWPTIRVVAPVSRFE